jgi:hypothetical protein
LNEIEWQLSTVGASGNIIQSVSFLMIFFLVRQGLDALRSRKQSRKMQIVQMQIKKVGVPGCRYWARHRASVQRSLVNVINRPPEL